MNQSSEPNSTVAAVSDQSSDLPVIDESIENVGNSTIHYLRRHPRAIIIPISSAILLEFIFVLFAVSIGFYFLPIAILFIAYGNIRGRIQGEFMQQFATANGYTYSASQTLDELEGILFQTGNNQPVENVVAGSYKNCPITLFNRFAKKKGESSYTIFEVQFATTMPYISLGVI